MRLLVEEGVLAFNYKSFAVTNGLETYWTISPSILFRLMYKKVKRDRVCGRWLLLGKCIIWFTKMKYYSETRLDQEKIGYSRKNIWLRM